MKCPRCGNTMERISGVMTCTKCGFQVKNEDASTGKLQSMNDGLSSSKNSNNKINS